MSRDHQSPCLTCERKKKRPLLCRYDAVTLTWKRKKKRPWTQRMQALSEKMICAARLEPRASRVKRRPTKVAFIIMKTIACGSGARE